MMSVSFTFNFQYNIEFFSRNLEIYSMKDVMDN